MTVKTALVLGSNGALGADVVRAFAKRKWRIVGADITLPKSETTSLFHSAVVIHPEWTMEKMQQTLLADTQHLNFDAIINVAGGWAGGSVADASTAAVTELMLRQSLFTSVVAAHLFAVRGNKNSFLALTGSAAALEGTSGMVGYGLAKAAVHHLVRSIAADASKTPTNSTVVGVLPITLDTPGNRSGMPQADFSAWTPTADAAHDLVSWSEGNDRPDSGSLVVWETKAGHTTKRCV